MILLVIVIVVVLNSIIISTTVLMIIIKITKLKYSNLRVYHQNHVCDSHDYQHLQPER